MKLGLMSDTHDDSVAVRSAVAIFNREGVSCVLHAGDIASPQVASAFEGLKTPFIGVCGNNDWDWSGLREAFAPYGTVYNGYFEGQFEGMRLALMHELRFMHMLPATRVYDIVVYGHSHHFETRKGSKLIVNPGQCKGCQTGEGTIAILDLPALSVEKIVLPGIGTNTEVSGGNHA